MSLISTSSSEWSCSMNDNLSSGRSLKKGIFCKVQSNLSLFPDIKNGLKRTRSRLLLIKTETVNRSQFSSFVSGTGGARNFRGSIWCSWFGGLQCIHVAIDCFSRRRKSFFKHETNQRWLIKAIDSLHNSSSLRWRCNLFLRSPSLCFYNGTHLVRPI